MGEALRGTRWSGTREEGRMVGPASLSGGTHSDYVLAVDVEGNVAAVCHSINTSLWGSTGLFVDGISIPDSASFQQAAVAGVGPGNYMYAGINPSIVLKNGRPFLASSAVGTALAEVPFQCVLGILGRGLDIASAVAMPLVHAADYTRGASIHS